MASYAYSARKIFQEALLEWRNLRSWDAKSISSLFKARRFSSRTMQWYKCLSWFLSMTSRFGKRCRLSPANSISRIHTNGFAKGAIEITKEAYYPFRGGNFMSWKTSDMRWDLWDAGWIVAWLWYCCAGWRRDQDAEKDTEMEMVRGEPRPCWLVKTWLKWARRRHGNMSFDLLMFVQEQARKFALKATRSKTCPAWLYPSTINV